MANGFLGLGVTVALPVGLGVTLIGGLLTLATLVRRGGGMLTTGSRLFTAGVAGAIAVGLVLRVMKAMTAYMC